MKGLFINGKEQASLRDLTMTREHLRLAKVRSLHTSLKLVGTTGRNGHENMMRAAAK